VRRRLAIVAASCAALLLGGGYAAANAATDTGTRSFSCIQTSVSRSDYWQVITGTLDASGAPHDVVVARQGVNEFGPVADPVLNNSSPFDYYKKTYNLDTWDLGTRQTDNFGPRHGYLGIPTRQSNAAAATFNAYWTEEWIDAGEWQKWFACTLS
jgi:hypothetical protein